MNVTMSKDWQPKRVQWLYTAGCTGLTGAFLLAALILYAKCGASPGGALLAWLLCGVCIGGPGAALRVLLCRAAPQQLAPVLTIVFGGAFFTLAALLASATGLHWLVAVLCGGGCVLRAVRLRREKMWFSGVDRRDLALLAVLWAGCVLLNALWAVRYIHPFVAEVARPNQDFFWNLGNVQSILQGFPVADLRVAGVTVSYHYLTELLQAGVCMLTGLPAYDVVAFYGYAPVAAGMLLCLYSLGRVLWGKDGRALALAAMPLLLGCGSLWKLLAGGASRFGNVMPLYVLSNINGQATAFVWLAAFFAIFAVLQAHAWQGGGLWIALTASFYLLTFSKSPQAAILALALACALVLRGIFAWCGGRRRPAVGLAAFVVLVPVGFWLVYRLCFSAGADSSMALSLTGTLEHYFFASILNALRIRFAGFWQIFVPVLWAAQSLLMAPAAFCVWAVSALWDLTRLPKVDALRLTWHACIVGGLLAFFLFDHYSSSQLYFAVLALLCLGLAFLDRLPGLWHGLSQAVRPAARALAATAKGAVAVLTAVSCISSVCLMIWLVGAAPSYLTGGEADERYLPLTAQEEQACAWLAEYAADDALFATNRMHTGMAMEGLSNVYTGLSGRQAYCESFKYAVSNMGENAGDVMARYDLVCRIFDPDTTPEQVKELCDRAGIRYLVYRRGAPGSDVQLAGYETVFDSEVVSIYKVM